MSDRSIVIKKTLVFVKKSLENDSSGHDWWHSYRVWNNAKLIVRKERNANAFVVQLAALLHDIADWKLHGGDETLGARKAAAWLRRCSVDKLTIKQVAEIIRNLEGASGPKRMKTIEGKIVQDADRLDAIGAIGVARTFAYGGYAGMKMYDPGTKPSSARFEGLKSTSTINHFYEKLLHARELMGTKTGRKMARDRDRYLRNFLNRFLEEWNGKDLSTNHRDAKAF